MATLVEDNKTTDIEPRNKDVREIIRNLYEKLTPSAELTSTPSKGQTGVHLVPSAMWSTRTVGTYDVTSFVYIPATTEEGDPVLYATRVDANGEVTTGLVRFDDADEDTLTVLFNILTGFNY
ncbi:hypothetical protein [Bifidobacterium callitrichidarum]|uniref:Uncharacterized protein n=1 Tax=Bifidobacterium callitrichidarum TaxID=2052941 RepID=A0A2U2N0R4_9BIFI|nr:hypothetical protein [Bifidobacterium callitrichidarum]PWG62658.1 hypothetical protein DF196_11915 [Bifidobacterium callitrichidarum]